MPCQCSSQLALKTELEGLVDLVTMEEWLWQGEDLGASWIKVQSVLSCKKQLMNGAPT